MTLEESLCGRFCAYYKPAKNEELACKGFLVVERMVREGKAISFERSNEPVGADTAAALALLLCGRCAFYQDDCDFAANMEAPPCGGYLLIGLLIDRGTLSLDDLRDLD